MASVVAGISNRFFCLKKTKKVFKMEKKNSKSLEELEKSCFVCLNLHFRAVSRLAVESLETEHLSLYLLYDCSVWRSPDFHHALPLLEYLLVSM